MSYIAKTDWRPEDPITEHDLNRWENGIKKLDEFLSTQKQLIEDVSDRVENFKTIKSNKDSNGIFTTITYRRKSDDSLLATSVLSGGTSPNYTTRTITRYQTDGITVRSTIVYTLIYDADGLLVSEV